MKDIVKGKISQSYARELARQVGELEAENEQLRDKVARLERDWDLRADGIRKYRLLIQKKHRAELKRARAGGDLRRAEAKR